MIEHVLLPDEDIEDGRVVKKTPEPLNNHGVRGIIKMDLQLFANGKQRAELYSVNWIEASLDETVKRLVPGATALAKSESGKVVYSSDSSNFAVIYDVEGDYFRIEDKRLTGKRRYVDINGNNVANIKENGKERGRTKDEYHKITHFKNGQKKGD